MVSLMTVGGHRLFQIDDWSWKIYSEVADSTSNVHLRFEFMVQVSVLSNSWPLLKVFHVLFCMSCKIWKLPKWYFKGRWAFVAFIHIYHQHLLFFVSKFCFSKQICFLFWIRYGGEIIVILVLIMRPWIRAKRKHGPEFDVESESAFQS